MTARNYFRSKFGEPRTDADKLMIAFAASYADEHHNLKTITAKIQAQNAKLDELLQAIQDIGNRFEPRKVKLSNSAPSLNTRLESLEKDLDETRQ